MNNKVCASIITYNIDEKIVEVVNSIVDQVEYLVIVDNGSKKETTNILKELEKIDKVNLILNSTNQGIAKALNQGVEFAKHKDCKWILTLDHDSICSKDMVQSMLNIEQNYLYGDKIGILAPQIFEVNKKDFLYSKSNENDLYEEIKECIQSGCIFNIELFDKIGYFDENLFIYHVDSDYCRRTVNSGYKIIQCNNIILYHEEGYKTPKKFLGINTFYNNYSSLATYYITRNTIYMSKKYNIFYMKRVIKDFIYISLYDTNKIERLRYWLKGVSHGIMGKLGKIDI